MSGNHDDASMNRRTLLKGLGTGTASVVGMSGMAAASADSDFRNELERSIAKRRAVEALDDEAVEAALSEKGEALRETLEAEDISVDFSREAFDEIRTLGDVRDGEATAHIVAKREDAERTLELHAFPQADESFAVEQTDSGLRRFEDEEVKPARFCETSTTCDGYCAPVATTPCGQQYLNGIEVEERCCTYSDGSTSCTTISENCTGDCPGYSC